MRSTLVLFIALCFSLAAHGQDSLDKLASEFWSWRAQFQPFNGDDVPRIERPAGLQRSWSQTSVARQRADLAAFESRWKKLHFANWPIAQEVDYRLMGSAFARVRWELDVNRRWQRDPTFYVEQAMTPVAEVLLPPPPIGEDRSRQLMARLQNIPAILEDGKANLQQAAGPFAKLAIDSLADVRGELQIVARDVTPLLTGVKSEDLSFAVEQAAAALEGFRAWLQQRLASMTSHTAVGRDAYTYFLKNVALYSFTPEQLLEMSRQEWGRSVAAEQLQREGSKDIAELTRFATLDQQLQRTAELENEVRRFLVERGILSVPASLPHYTARPLPTYVAALGRFSETDDFTGPSRLSQDCVRWTGAPSDKMGYFENAAAHDPRPLIVHEGVPGHYMQLWLSWRNPDPIRRHYYDSGANEGLGFYAEEMMLLAGLFVDSPHTREIIYNFMRQRALRVEVDVKLALGELTGDQAAAYLEKMVPMPASTARSEAAAFATQPGQAISYQIGKLQIVRFLADARLRAGDKFNLQAFHDFVWLNGNVPIELQRLEWFADKPPGQTASKLN